jgi:hypothetical protein
VEALIGKAEDQAKLQAQPAERQPLDQPSTWQWPLAAGILGALTGGIFLMRRRVTLRRNQ